MGLFDFIKDAGAKLIGADDDDDKTPSAPSGPSTTAPDPDEVRRVINRRRSLGLIRRVNDLGLDIEDLQIQVDGASATVRGKVSDQATKEKVILAVGNTEGVARVDDQIEVEESEPEATFYTVQAGDTLSGIAKDHYGRASQYMAIFEANRPMLDNPDRIYPGQVLRIPPLAE